MTQFSNSFEGISQGTTITAGNSGGSSGDAFTSVHIGTGSTVISDNAHAAHGTQAMKILMPASGAQVTYVEWDPTAMTDYYGRMYIYMGQGHSDLIIYDGGNGGVDEALLIYNGSNKIDIWDSSLAIKATSTNTLALNTWHRIEFHVICSTTVGQIQAQLFIGSNFDGVTPDETVTTAANLNTGASNNQFLFGNISTNVNDVMWLDDIGCGYTSYPGPAILLPKPYIPRRMPLAA